MSQGLYQGAAEYYAQYRTQYPIILFEKLTELFSLNGQGRLLDLACGPGTIAIPLSQKFEDVIAIDSDLEMVNICQNQASKNGHQNITCMQNKAEDIDKSLGVFKLTTIARAFHWMDRPIVLQRIYDVLDDDGGLAIIATDEDPRRGIHAWEQVVSKVVEKWLGNSYPAQENAYPIVPHETILDESAFESYEKYSIQFGNDWAIANYIGYLYSTSFCLSDFLTNKKKDFEKDLTEQLLKIEPSGHFYQTINVDLLIARKRKRLS